VAANAMNFKVVIPARLGSTRLPRKVLRPVHGRPLVQYAWQAACASGAAEVVVATDSPEVQAACAGFGATVAMTAITHASGTDRVNEVATARGWAPDTIVVNLQGDEPLMPPAMIRQAAALLAEGEEDIATLCHPLHALDDWLNPKVVKVVMAESGRALYFSRAPIPWRRDGASRQAPLLPEGSAYRHIGLYAYRVAALARFSALPPGELERIEALEQLRALEHGLTIRVGVSHEPPPRGVDTEEDLQAVAGLLRPS
jgi:3-deoxy-manno-octulosonate cytidylyltransferase (CMP-KDO synthetase)